MKPSLSRVCASLLAFALLASCAAPQPPAPTAMPTAAAAWATSTAAPPAAPTRTATPRPASTTAPAATSVPASADPDALISQASLFATLKDLTGIRPHAGWRSSATRGEAEALDYVAGRLAKLGYLQSIGLEQERQSFRIPLSLELWEARLELTIGGQAVQVPADGLRGNRDNIGQSLALDSDGRLNDTDHNPLTGEGPVVAVRTLDELRKASAAGKVVLLDYAGVDRMVAPTEQAGALTTAVLAAKPAGVVLVTHFSNQAGESHGTFAGELSLFAAVKAGTTPPVLCARLEDLAAAGIGKWEDLANIQSARLTLDADLIAPATSGNLVARIPGADSSRAMILGAHIDSPNGPGAMDDGGGAAALLEVARVLDAARVRPPVDLYLVWFGCEEAGLYGSAYFATTHQELLDRALAMLELDCLTRPLDGIDASQTLSTWSYAWLGDSRVPWSDYLVQAAGRLGVTARAENLYGIDSDNSSFAGFGLPNADLSYMDSVPMNQLGLHYAGHLHDPYDTVELTRDVAAAFVETARIGLVAALQAGKDAPSLQVPRQPDRRVVFVASHTEAVHMTPAGMLELGMALTWDGYDVDMIPYGQTVTAADLQDAALVVALPVVDYPSPDGDATLYDEAWKPEEIAALEGYVAGGGLLVLTNSANRLKYINQVAGANEDWSDANALAERFGISYQSGTLAGSTAQVEGASPLMQGVTSLRLIDRNGVPFSIQQGQVLARVGGQPAVALVGRGRGQVLALADLGMLGDTTNGPMNLSFWHNLASYARSR